MNNPISRWFREMARVWSRELRLTFTDAGMLLFFFALPLVYPLVYTLIYNPEVVTDIPVAVVDDSRTSASRELTRSIDATSAIKVIGYATSLSEARQWQADKRCYGILVIHGDYARNLGRGEQAHVDFYSDMSLLLRFRTFLSALTDVQLATGAKIRTQAMEAAGMPASEAPIASEAFFLGDAEQGFASFIIPGIVVLIIQQSMILSIAMLIGTSRERRRRNGGIDPLEIQASPSATMTGKLLAYLVPYLPMAVYALHYVPLMFSLPHVGSMTQYLPFFLPMLIASAAFGLVISEIFVKEREMSLMVVVFTSVAFLFLSGLTWPRYAMHPVWQWIGGCVPAVWGVEGFIRINSNGATLAQNSHPYLMLWILAAVYCFVYWLILKSKQRI